MEELSQVYLFFPEGLESRGGSTSAVRIEMKIRLHPIHILSVIFSPRKMTEKNMPKTDSRERKSDARAGCTYLSPTFCKRNPTMEAPSPRNMSEYITLEF